jgi:hypothetical protein
MGTVRIPDRGIDPGRLLKKIQKQMKHHKEAFHG